MSTLNFKGNKEFPWPEEDQKIKIPTLEEFKSAFDEATQAVITRDKFVPVSKAWLVAILWRVKSWKRMEFSAAGNCSAESPYEWLPGLDGRYQANISASVSWSGDDSCPDGGNWWRDTDSSVERLTDESQLIKPHITDQFRYGTPYFQNDGYTEAPTYPISYQDIDNGSGVITHQAVTAFFNWMGGTVTAPGTTITGSFSAYPPKNDAHYPPGGNGIYPDNITTYASYADFAASSPTVIDGETSQFIGAWSGPRISFNPVQFSDGTYGMWMTAWNLAIGIEWPGVAWPSGYDGSINVPSILSNGLASPWSLDGSGVAWPNNGLSVPQTTCDFTFSQIGNLTVQVAGFPDMVFPQYASSIVVNPSKSQDSGYAKMTAEITSFDCTLKAVEYWEYNGRWNGTTGAFNRF